MGKLQWLKTKVGLFSDPRIIFLLNQPNGDSYLTLWTFLKDMAGQVNDGGKIYVAEKEPLTVALIAKCLHRRKPFIEKGLAILVHIDLIEQTENGMLQIKVWNDLQDFQRDEHRREMNAKRQQRYRERQRQAKETNMAVAEEPPQSSNTDSSPEGAIASPAGSLVGACMEKRDEEKEYSADMEEPNARPLETAAPEFLPEIITEEPEIVKNVSHYRSVKKYQEVFHGINGLIAEKLANLERMWGTQATCTAIDIAKKNRKNHVSYMEGILRQSNGNPIKEETQHERLKREQEEYYAHLNAMLQQNQQTERAENAHDGSSAAADDERYRVSGPYAEIGNAV